MQFQLCPGHNSGTTSGINEKLFKSIELSKSALHSPVRPGLVQRITSFFSFSIEVKTCKRFKKTCISALKFQDTGNGYWQWSEMVGLPSPVFMFYFKWWREVFILLNKYCVVVLNRYSNTVCLAQFYDVMMPTWNRVKGCMPFTDERTS